MTHTVKSRLWLFARIGVSLALITFLLRSIDLGKLAESVVSAHIGYVVAALFVGCLAWVLNSFKWQILLKALGMDVRVKSLFALNLIGIFYGIFLPGQVGGDVVRGIILARQSHRNADTVVSVAADRASGLMAMLLVALPAVALAAPGEMKTGLLQITSFSLALVLAVSLVVLVRPLSRLAEKAGTHALKPGLLGWSKRYLVPSWRSLLTYSGKVSMWSKVTFYAIAFQLLATAVNYFVCLALGVRLSFVEIAWIYALASIIAMLPISISGIGVREGAYVFLLGKYGVSSPDALAVSLIVFGLLVVLGLIGGAIQLFGGFDMGPGSSKEGWGARSASDR